jgi:hypothetical protein
MFLFTRSVDAIENPLLYPNNKYGIHIVDENDISDASELVNSSGGEWGYVVMVIPETDRNSAKWQRIFNKLRKYKLIPIIRLATSPQNGGWRKPTIQDVDEWVSFLSSLNWVIQNRYVILFNEPNHGYEWGGIVNPEEYADLVTVFHEKLKNSSEDFFILNAGLDQATNNNHTSMSEELFLKRMYEYNPTIYKLFDGWVSHSYANPGFSGNFTDKGKATITGYRWELSLITKFGMNPSIPVFVTETGWTHAEGKTYNELYKPVALLPFLFTTSYTLVWIDPSLVVISPFLLNYQDDPFSHFSWKEYQSQSFYPHYYAVQSINKTKGVPPQITKAVVSLSGTPDDLFTNSKFYLPIKINNVGQTIWDEPNTIKLKIIVENAQIDSEEQPIKPLEPFSTATNKYFFETGDKTEDMRITAQIYSDAGPISDSATKIIHIRKPKTLWESITYISGKLSQFYLQSPFVNPRDVTVAPSITTEPLVPKNEQ